ISASPFVGQRVLGMGPFTYALSFAAGASALIFVNLVNARIAPRVGPARMLLIGFVIMLAGSIGMLGQVVAGMLTIPGFIVCAFIITGGAGFAMSNSSALSLALAGRARGSGSALVGAAQFGIGGLAAPIVGLWGEHTALPMAIVALSTTVLGLLLTLGSEK